MAKKPIITREVAPLPTRAPDAHKGQVGRVMIIGGCVGEVTMVGAPALAARAALRSGAGLVQLVVPAAAQVAAIAIEPCATARALPQSGERRGQRSSAPTPLSALAEDFDADVVAVGPGLGHSITPEALEELLTHCQKPIVADADALNLLASMKPFDIPNPRRVVLTPHPGEMRRLLAGWCGTGDSPVAAEPGTGRSGHERAARATPSDRQAAALRLAEAFGTVVVLKGRGTVVTDAERLYINESGNAGMASAGTGDVLTGIIAAMIGQGLAPLEASILGVHLHGLAGDFAAMELGQLPLTAVDLIDALPDAFAEYAQ